MGQITIGGRPLNSLSYEELDDFYKKASAGPHSSIGDFLLRPIRNRMNELYPQYQQEQQAKQFQAQLAAYREQMAEYQKQQLEHQKNLEAYQTQQMEYMNRMAEVMETPVEEPALEPLKAAQEVQSEARADTNRKQLLRKGLMSTMTRFGNQGRQRDRLGA